MRSLTSWRLWLGGLVGATVLTALTTTQTYASRRVEGFPAHWAQILPQQAIDWYGWSVLVPSVIAVASAVAWTSGRRTRLILSWTALGVGFAAIHALIEVIVARAFHVVPTRMSFGTMLSARLTDTLAANLIVLGLLVLSYYAVDHYRLAREREQREAALETRLAEARLEILRHQLQPHFLFNTLHTISALVGDDVGAARRVITRLGDLLRSSLDTADRQEVALRDELTFLRHYLDIQHTRFGDRLRTRMNVSPGLDAALVPSMVLQPLVENSIRHAVEPRADGAEVTLHASRHEDTLVLEVADDGPGMTSEGVNGDGIGLSNTRERLTRLYGNAHELRFENVPNGGLRVILSLPFRTGGA